MALTAIELKRRLGHYIELEIKHSKDEIKTLECQINNSANPEEVNRLNPLVEWHRGRIRGLLEIKEHLDDLESLGVL